MKENLRLEIKIRHLKMHQQPQRIQATPERCDAPCINKENKANEANTISQGEENLASNNRSHRIRNANSKAAKKRKAAQTTVARINSTTENTSDVNSEVNRRKRKEPQNIEKRKVSIVGDSQLRKISGEKLTKDHHSVNVKAMPGAQMKEVHIDKDVNVGIIHAGTCNIRKQTNPEKLSDEIVSTLKDIKAKLPKAQVAFSSILKRNDDLELNARVRKTNQLLQEKLLFSGLDYIDNDNIRYGNISFDGLLINEGGVKFLASNYSKYVRYCWGTQRFLDYFVNMTKKPKQGVKVSQ